MKVLLFGLGSRGDVQPFAALGKGLQAAGYTVALAAGENFAGLAAEHGLGFEPIRVDIEALMNSDIGKQWSDRGNNRSSDELRHMRRLGVVTADPVADAVVSLIERYDVFITGFLTLDPLAAAAAARGKIVIAGHLGPWPPTRSGAANFQAPFPDGESLFNAWMGYLVQVILYFVLRPPTVEIRRRLHLPAPSLRAYLRAWNRTPALVGVSPLVVPPPPDWPSHVHTTGYWFLDAPSQWQPPPALTAFLDAGEPPVYIGFGSMASRNPQATLNLMIAALTQAGQRGVIYKGWAGFLPDRPLPDIFLLDGAPHDWLFPRMKAVIHHGGAGTTSAVLRAGVPGGIVVHAGDQAYWGRRTYELGVGAQPIPRAALTVENLSGMIRALTGDPALRERAAALGERIRAEDGIGNAVRAFTHIVQG
ncbi:MAG: glycosyltransferase [bacterium]|nr:glycosyltransferase [bacterium]